MDIVIVFIPARVVIQIALFRSIGRYASEQACIGDSLPRRKLPQLLLFFDADCSPACSRRFEVVQVVPCGSIPERDDIRIVTFGLNGPFLIVGFTEETILDSFAPGFL